MGSTDTSRTLRLAQGCGWLTCVRRLGSARSCGGSRTVLRCSPSIQWLWVEAAMLHFQQAPRHGEAEVLTEVAKS